MNDFYEFRYLLLSFGMIFLLFIIVKSKAGNLRFLDYFINIKIKFNFNIYIFKIFSFNEYFKN